MSPRMMPRKKIGWEDCGRLADLSGVLNRKRPVFLLGVPGALPLKLAEIQIVAGTGDFAELPVRAVDGVKIGR